MSIANPILFKIGCATMVSILGMGARFGHAGALSQVGSTMFAKAQLYNMSNTLGFIACSLISTPSIPLNIAIGALAVGQALFICPLYYTAVTDQKHSVISKLMPVGGLSLITAWISLMLAA